MIGLIYRIIVGRFHQHQWETVKEFRQQYDHDWRAGTAEVKILRCKKCGTWKKKSLY